MPKRYAGLLGSLLLLGLSACPMVEPMEPLPQYKPLLMARQQLEQAVAVLPPQNMGVVKQIG